MRVTVIDYKAGNLTSVLKALRHLGRGCRGDGFRLVLVESAERIVLPGVGHFAATERLDATGLTHAIRAAIARGVPFLGICVGMQWLLRRQQRSSRNSRALAIFTDLRAIRRGQRKVPHVGWNTLVVRALNLLRLLAGIRGSGGEYAYFTHSYYVPVSAGHRRQVHRTTSSRSRRQSNTPMCWACSFTPKNPARQV